MTEPFIKWAGGKRQLLDALLPKILERLSSGGAYFEPFLGGGAVALSMSRDVVVTVSDACEPLVETWRVVCSQTASLARALVELGENHNPAHYYAVRASSPDTPLERAARFIYLNKAGFNGLYRVNRAGAFNVPIGRGRATGIPTHAQLEAVARLARHWNVECCDFEPVIDAAREGDVVFADPPYDGTFDYASRFGTVARIRLVAALRRAARRGVGVIATDADTPLVRRMYSWANVKSISERRRVSASANSRGDAACVVAVRP